MRVRNYTPVDEKVLREIHAAQGLEYEFPDLSNPLYLVKVCGVDENGQVRAAGIARLTAEVFYLIDPKLDSADKRKILELGLLETAHRLEAQGLDEFHCFVPPQLNGMGQLLQREFGFRPDWKCYFRETGNGTRST